MAKKVILGLIIIVILAGGGYLLFHKTKSNTSTTSGNTSSQSSSSSNSQKIAATITYSNDGFSPAQTTVSSGDTVAIKNTSSSTMNLDSDPHPVHTDDSDLNVGAVDAGQTKTFVVTKKGSFGFHNHLDPSQRGNITIQ